MGWNRTSRHSRGYGSAWDKLRQSILERDKYLCQQCLRDGVLTGLVIGNRKHPRGATVDHITPKAEGGTDDPSNLEALCRLCHERKTNGSRRIGCDEDGWPIDPQHHWNERDGRGEV